MDGDAMTPEQKARKVAEEVARRVIPPVVIFAEHEEHVEYLRQLASDAITTALLQFAREQESEVVRTPDSSLPPLGDGPRRKMVITIEVTEDFEKRLDNQWMVEREIHADRWQWRWADEVESEAVRELVAGLEPFAEFANSFRPNVTPSYCDVAFEHCRKAATLVAQHSKKVTL